MKFKDITSQKADVVQVVQSTLTPSSKVRIFQRKDTMVIYSVSEHKKHASISNPAREITESEIRLIILNIMGSTIEESFVYTNGNGIIHILDKPKQHSIVN